MTTLYPKQCDDETGSLALFPKKNKYGSITSAKAQELELLIGKPNLVPRHVEHELAEVIYLLFMATHHHSHAHPRTNPQLPPEKRGARHRNFWVWALNQFRHWWKTSRLLVRCSGAYVFCKDPMNWSLMGLWDVTVRKQMKMAAKQSKRIGQGGLVKPFLEEVHPFTRSIRIALALARAWEAKVDNRLYEVGLAEGFAFMGNRCSRFWTRSIVDYLTSRVALPISGALIAPYLDQNSRPVMVAMGLLRAILPFAASFQGSRVGRQLTFNTYKYASYRWKPIQSINNFHERSGNYQDINLDEELLEIARNVAESVGRSKDPKETRTQLKAIGFHVFGTGSGGYTVFRLKIEGRIILLHMTPYGPSIDDEMPRYILLERRRTFYVSRLGGLAQATILDAATPREAKVQGFTYSGAFFQAQEWAALSMRHDRELADYSNACKIMRTRRLSRHKRNPQETHEPTPPTDLLSLKSFIRSGRQNYQQWRSEEKWRQITKEVRRMSDVVSRYQREGRAAKRVILYLEGLDCAGKSSTGGLICSALEQCGFSVTTAQHNRPPTPEQSQKPWMHRIRFQYPDDMYPAGERPEYASVVWDRGPAGDFAYGSFSQLSLGEKMEKYKEFRAYDCQCREDGVLFIKCFFVTDKDSIAATLGKRLAHREILRDLRTWLDANSVAQIREGLDEIAMHIDPTDFIAFNNYERNLSKFADFVRNTDKVGHLGDHRTYSFADYENPWFVVNTSDRHSARLGLLRAFRGQLKRFASTEGDSRKGLRSQISQCFALKADDEFAEDHYVPSGIVEEKEKGVSARAVFQSFLLLLLFYAYAYQTWNFTVDQMT